MPATRTSRVPTGIRDAEIASPAPAVPRRVWLDLLVPDGVDVEQLLVACAGRARLVVQSEPVAVGADLRDVFFAESVELGVEGFYVEAYCRICGCTDSNACGDGCWWVEVDLCSSCAEHFAMVDPRPVATVPVQEGLL